MKENIFLTCDVDDTVKYRWLPPTSKWTWQTFRDTFVRPGHLSYTYTHLLDVLNHFTPAHGLSLDKMLPVYITGEVPPPQVDGHSSWFTLTVTTQTLKQRLFSEFFDFEMGQTYVLREDPRDPEHL